jgi:glycosyltransferase involved in cell wall biosynthesis
LASLANHIVCVSESVKSKRFGRFGPKIKHKISVVYNGVDTSVFQERNGTRSVFRSRLSVTENEILIGLVGNIIPRKAQDFFIKGFAKTKQLYPEISAKALIVGHFLDKDYKNYLKQLVTDLKLESSIIFHEFSDDIPNILSALDIFALSSRSEGFCRSLLEAMSCGLPIIATRISEIEEAITEKKNGILVDFMKIDQMASAIMSLCQNKMMRDEIGKRNRLKAQRYFNLDGHSKTMEALYLNILKG